ncbi:erythropoietin receptor isoform X4 [Strix uralensis]|uniref:erythropoietin receptor isoform X4 n=1 Tax=Strix uralensis TaxID=36305 RepID=UPI003DA6F769
MAASRCPPRAARSRGASQGAASPPGRGPRAQHWWLQQDLTAGALRGGLGRLWLRVEEAERLTGLYRRLGAHLEEEAGAARARLERLEAELSRRRRRLRDLRDRRDAATRPGRERVVGVRRVRGARARAPEEEPGQEPPEPPDPPQETPEPEEAEEGPEGAPPRAPPPPTPPRPPPSSTSPQRAARRAVGLELAALARGQALALGELRAEAAALGERLQRLRYGGEGQRAGARRAEELRQRLAQERRRRAGARRDLAEVRRDLGTATAALGHLAGRLRGLALEDGGAQPQPPPGDPQALSQLLAQTRAGLVALQGGLRGCPQTQRPPPNTLPQLRALMQRPDTEDPMAPPYSSDAGVLLAEEPLDPKCFSRRLHDLTCFWESDAPPDPRPFRLQYRLEQEPWQACELAAAPVTRNRSRFWCSLPPAAAVAFVPLELRVLPPPPGPPLHHRTLLLDQVGGGVGGAAGAAGGGPAGQHLLQRPGPHPPRRPQLRRLLEPLVTPRHRRHPPRHGPDDAGAVLSAGPAAPQPGAAWPPGPPQAAEGEALATSARPRAGVRGALQRLRGQLPALAVPGSGGSLGPPRGWPRGRGAAQCRGGGGPPPGQGPPTGGAPPRRCPPRRPLACLQLRVHPLRSRLSPALPPGAPP